MVNSDRALALLDHVAAALAEFANKHGEEPEGVVLAIRGKDGTLDTSWMLHEDSSWRAELALAGALFLHTAAAPDEAIDTGD